MNFNSTPIPNEVMTLSLEKVIGANAMSRTGVGGNSRIATVWLVLYQD